MSHRLRALGRSSMLALAAALRSDRLGAQFSRSAVGALVPDYHVEAVCLALQALTAQGMSRLHIATVLELLAEERAAHQRQADRVDLVLSPPELDRVDARDTSVVVRDLFHRAQHSVLVASFAIDAGDKAKALFGELAARMDTEPELQVQVHLNVHRKHQDATPTPRLIRDFKRRFRDEVWPGERLPDVFYDPRSVELEGPKRAVLHAKCVVVDGRWTLITSANFTEAAQERNIEAGVLLDDTRTAERLRRQFLELVEAGLLVPL